MLSAVTLECIGEASRLLTEHLRDTTETIPLALGRLLMPQASCVFVLIQTIYLSQLLQIEAVNEAG